jgi:hypothetical protein
MSDGDGGFPAQEPPFARVFDRHARIAMSASPCLRLCVAMSARKARRHHPSARVHPLRARASLTHNKKQREDLDDDFRLELPSQNDGCGGLVCHDGAAGLWAGLEV